MTGRIVEEGLKKVVEEGPKICEWWDPKRAYAKSLCSPECEGGNEGCPHVSYRAVRSSKGNHNNRTNSDSIPDYLL